MWSSTNTTFYPTTAAAFDLRTVGTSADRNTPDGFGEFNYDGLLRWETDTQEFMLYKVALGWVTLRSQMGSGSFELFPTTDFQNRNDIMRSALRNQPIATIGALAGLGLNEVLHNVLDIGAPAAPSAPDPQVQVIDPPSVATVGEALSLPSVARVTIGTYSPDPYDVNGVVLAASQLPIVADGTPLGVQYNVTSNDITQHTIRFSFHFNQVLTATDSLTTLDNDAYTIQTAFGTLLPPGDTVDVRAYPTSIVTNGTFRFNVNIRTNTRADWYTTLIWPSGTTPFIVENLGATKVVIGDAATWLETLPLTTADETLLIDNADTEAVTSATNALIVNLDTSGTVNGSTHSFSTANPPPDITPLSINSSITISGVNAAIDDATHVAIHTSHGVVITNRERRVHSISYSLAMHPRAPIFRASGPAWYASTNGSARTTDPGETPLTTSLQGWPNYASAATDLLRAAYFDAWAARRTIYRQGPTSIENGQIKDAAEAATELAKHAAALDIRTAAGLSFNADNMTSAQVVAQIASDAPGTDTSSVTNIPIFNYAAIDLQGDYGMRENVQSFFPLNIAQFANMGVPANSPDTTTHQSTTSGSTVYVWNQLADELLYFPRRVNSVEMYNSLTQNWETMDAERYRTTTVTFNVGTASNVEYFEWSSKSPWEDNSGNAVGTNPPASSRRAFGLRGPAQLRFTF
jgi:hypothetical protein